MQKIIERINIIVIIVIILLSTFFVGMPSGELNVYNVYIISGIYGIIYFVFKLIKKEKIVTNILDIFILILSFSTFVPLIFSNYVSLSDTFVMIFKFITLANIFLIVKNECTKNNKYLKIIVNTILASILIMCFIGIEQICGNNLHQFKQEVLNYNFIQYTYQNRLYSLLSSANVMAVVAGIGVFLSLGCFFENRNIKLKIIYMLSAIITFVTLVLTYSRMGYVVFALFGITYLAIILFKKYNIRERITKKVIIIFAIILIIITGYVIMGLNIAKPISLKEPFYKVVYHIEGNKDYKFSFDIKNMHEDDVIIVELKERNYYYDDTRITQIEILGESEEKSVQLHTLDSTVVIYLSIYVQNLEDSDNIIIENCYMNDNNFVLENKLLPTSMVDRIKSINLKNSSLAERIALIEDGLKLVPSSFMFGNGGNSWASLYPSVYQYNYSITDVHCFPLQLILNSGIIAFIAYLGIIFMVLKFLYGELKSKKHSMFMVSLCISILFLLVHSLLDIDLSIFYVLLLFFVMLAIVSSKIVNGNMINKGNKIKNIIFYIILIMVTMFMLYGIIGKIFYYNTEKIIPNTSNTKEYNRDLITNYNSLMPYDREIKEDLYVAISKENEIDYRVQKNILRNIIETEKYAKYNVNLNYIYSYVNACLQDKENFQENMDFAMNYIKETEFFTIYNPEYQMFRLNSLIRIRDLLSNANELVYAEKLKEQLQEEVNTKEIYILDPEKTRYKEESLKSYKRIIEEIKSGAI